MHARLLLASVTCASAFLLTACSGGGASHPSAAAPASASDPAAPALPSTAQLTAALLTTADLGNGFVSHPQTGLTADAAAGCPALDGILGIGAPPGSGRREVNGSWQVSTTGPFVNEGLIAEPAAVARSDYAQAAAAGCRTITLASEGTSIPFTISPVSSASAGPASAGPASASPAGASSEFRLTGAFHGIPVTAYLFVGKAAPDVLIGYLYTALLGGSSQVAQDQFAKAESRAGQALSGA